VYRLLAGCYTLCYSFGRERVHSASHSMDESVLIDLVNINRTPLLELAGWSCPPSQGGGTGSNPVRAAKPLLMGCAQHKAARAAPRVRRDCYTLCYSFGRERVDTVSHSMDSLALFALFSTWSLHRELPGSSMVGTRKLWRHWSALMALVGRNT
jgi:hypothetical protein